MQTAGKSITLYCLFLYGKKPESERGLNSNIYTIICKRSFREILFVFAEIFIIFWKSFLSSVHFDWKISFSAISYCQILDKINIQLLDDDLIY